MDKQIKTSVEQKFLTLNVDKQDRIINAAMKEFSYGYKKASTDAIVREAGISKGLLFHYFGTKEHLYEFLVHYTMDMMQTNYFENINLAKRDILESIWQMCLLKRDISDKHPPIYDFINSVSTHMKDNPKAKISSYYAKRNKALMEDLYKNCDISLFREDVNPQKAIDIIVWGLNSVFEAEEVKKVIVVDTDDESQNRERFLEELRSYLDMLRLCFYKKK